MKFKTGDIVRYVWVPQWLKYVTEGSVLEIRMAEGADHTGHERYYCRLLLGDKLDIAPYGEDMLFFGSELEAIHDGYQGR